LADIAIGLLKIAYEFVADQYPEYINERYAKKIALILRKCQKEEAYRLMKKIPIGQSLNKYSHLHIIMLRCFEKQLLCHIMISDIFDTFFIMNDDCLFLCDDIILVNPIKQRYKIFKI